MNRWSLGGWEEFISECLDWSLHHVFHFLMHFWCDFCVATIASFYTFVRLCPFGRCSKQGLRHTPRLKDGRIFTNKDTFLDNKETIFKVYINNEEVYVWYLVNLTIKEVFILRYIWRTCEGFQSVSMVCIWESRHWGFWSRNWCKWKMNEWCVWVFKGFTWSKVE